jgi:cation transport ATPase
MKRTIKLTLNFLITIFFLLILYLLGLGETFIDFLTSIDHTLNGILSWILLLSSLIVSYFFIQKWMGFKKLSLQGKFLLITATVLIVVYSLFPILNRGFCMKDSDCVLFSGSCCPRCEKFEKSVNNKYYRIFRFINCDIFKKVCPFINCIIDWEIYQEAK